MAESSEGRVEALWIKRTSGGLMDAVDQADLLEERGIVGNANQGGRRQVTILSVEAWTRIEEILGEGVDPSTRRANVLVRGIDLERSRGRILALGECRVRIRGAAPIASSTGSAVSRTPAAGRRRASGDACE